MMNVLHYVDTEDSKETERYKLGFRVYAALFTLLAAIQFGVVVFAFYLYVNLFRLLHLPRTRKVGEVRKD